MGLSRGSDLTVNSWSIMSNTMRTHHLMFMSTLSTSCSLVSRSSCGRVGLSSLTFFTVSNMTWAVFDSNTRVITFVVPGHWPLFTLVVTRNHTSFVGQSHSRSTLASLSSSIVLRVSRTFAESIITLASFMSKLWALTSSSHPVRLSTVLTSCNTGFFTRNLGHSNEFTRVRSITRFGTLVHSRCLTIITNLVLVESLSTLGTSVFKFVVWTSESLTLLTVLTDSIILGILSIGHRVTSTHH